MMSATERPALPEGAISHGDRKELANRRYDALVAAEPWLAPEEIQRVARLITLENGSVRSRQRKFIHLMTKMSESMAPHVACRRGCSHCCNISAVILASEVERIAEATGRPMTRLPMREPAAVEAAAAGFFRTPCPFLAGSECSIYDARPSVCRLHHSLNLDADQCDTVYDINTTMVPTLASTAVVQFEYLSMSIIKEPVGDIREFFPLDPS